MVILHSLWNADGDLCCWELSRAKKTLSLYQECVGIGKPHKPATPHTDRRIPEIIFRFVIESKLFQPHQNTNQKSPNETRVWKPLIWPWTSGQMSRGLFPNRGWEINQVCAFCCSNAGKISPPILPCSSWMWECYGVSLFLADPLYLLISHHECYQWGLSFWSQCLHSPLLFKSFQQSDQKLTFSLIKTVSHDDTGKKACNVLKFKLKSIRKINPKT